VSRRSQRKRERGSVETFPDVVTVGAFVETIWDLVREEDAAPAPSEPFDERNGIPRIPLRRR
jgi:hypothetical protein